MNPLNNNLQTFAVVGGFLLTLIGFFGGPKAVSKAKERLRKANRDDVAYLENLVGQLERANIQRDQMIEFLQSKLSKSQQKVQKLEDAIKKIETEKEIAIHHQEVIKSNLSNQNTTKTTQ